MDFSRLKRLQSAIDKASYDVFIVNNPYDIYYLSGLEMSAGELWVSNKNALWYIDGRYTGLCRSQTPLEVYHNREIGMNALLALPFFKECPALAFDETATSYHSYTQLRKDIEPLPFTLEAFTSPVSRLRGIKDPQEIALLRQAAMLGQQGIELAFQALHVGITECAIASLIRKYWLEQGAAKVSFDPIVAFGPNSALPHHRPTARPLAEGDVVLIDAGVSLNHYCSDMTRTAVFGTPTPLFLEVWHLVKQAQEEALKNCKKGVSASDLDAIARLKISSKGYGKEFSHSLGHGLGLEVHEWPPVNKKSTALLEEGMVLAIEPGIYIEGAFGVRIEDCAIVGELGPERLILDF